MQIVDGARKTAFTAMQGLAARALADAVPDPHAKRLAARGVFVAIDSFIAVGRRTRKTVPSNKRTTAALRGLKTRFNVLDEKDWGPYAQMRDRLGAHRQPISGGDGVEGWVAANELWAQIDAPLVGVLCDDMMSIQADLQAAAGGPLVITPALPHAVADAIAAAPEFAPRDRGLQFDAGSFGETRQGHMTPLQGGEIGERLRQINDTIDGFEFYATLMPLVAGHQPFERVVRAGAVIEVCNIIELALDVPAGRASANYYAPLVDLVPAGYAENADLRAARAGLPAADVAWIRDLRDTIAAHVDDRAPIADLVRNLDQADLSRLDTLFHYVTKTLEHADRHPITVLSTLVRLRGRVLAGVERSDPPEHAATYLD